MRYVVKKWLTLNQKKMWLTNTFSINEVVKLINDTILCLCYKYTSLYLKKKLTKKRVLFTI